MENGSDSGRTNSILSANTKLTGNNAIITNTKSLPNVINIHLNNDLVVKGTKNETFRVTQEDKDKVYPLNLSFNSPVIEVSPEKYQQLKTQNNVHTFMDMILNKHHKRKSSSNCKTVWRQNHHL